MTAPAHSRHAPLSEASLRDEVLRGLTAQPKVLPPKLFYDARGARLFEEICEQPEYYLTRAELEILSTHAQELAGLAGRRAALVEYGSGAGIKVRKLLDALESPVAYVPVDISREQLKHVAGAIKQDYPDVRVRPVWADYTKRFVLPHLPAAAERVALFPGSTVGNFHPRDAAGFLRGLRSVVGYDGSLILGVDRRKDPTILNAAYNDAAGRTAEFNLNLLDRLNRELGADFARDRFAHRAFFNPAASRVEMHLESRVDQLVDVAGAMIPFRQGETIWTESSYKYDEKMLEALARDSGFDVVRCFTDTREYFWVVFLRARQRTTD